MKFDLIKSFRFTIYRHLVSFLRKSFLADHYKATKNTEWHCNKHINDRLVNNKGFGLASHINGVQSLKNFITSKLYRNQ